MKIHIIPKDPKFKDIFVEREIINGEMVQVISVFICKLRMSFVKVARMVPKSVNAHPKSQELHDISNFCIKRLLTRNSSLIPLGGWMNCDLSYTFLRKRFRARHIYIFSAGYLVISTNYLEISIRL